MMTKAGAAGRGLDEPRGVLTGARWWAPLLETLVGIAPAYTVATGREQWARGPSGREAGRSVEPRRDGSASRAWTGGAIPGPRERGARDVAGLLGLPDVDPEIDMGGPVHGTHVADG